MPDYISGWRSQNEVPRNRLVLLLRSILYRLDQRPVHFALIALLSVVAAAWLHAHWSRAEYFDDLALDSYFKLRGAHRPAEVANVLPYTKNIILIETTYLMPRRLQAQLLNKLRLAKVVAFDFLFVDQEKELTAEEVPLYRAEIQQWRSAIVALMQSVKRHGRVVLGTWPEEEKIGTVSMPDTVSTGKAESEIWQQPPRVLWDAARYHAHLTVESGVTRHVQLFRDTSEGASARVRMPSLGLAIAAAYLGLSPSEVSRLSVKDGSLIIKGRPLSVGSERMRIDYLGGRECFESLENHIFYTSALQYEPEDFKDKIVIIGESSRKSKEILETPFGPMPGMQVHANIVATLLNPRGAPIDLGTSQTILLALALCVVLVAPFLRLPLFAGSLVLLFLIALTVLLGGWLFITTHRVLPLSTPLFALFLTYNGVMIYEYRRARETLGRFIGREMVAPTLNVFSRLRLGGRVEVATAFFCDLRGYTLLTEKLAPDSAARLIGQYTSTLVQVVKKYGGRPVDYQGDGVFVIFERALCGEYFARQAVLAAVELLDHLQMLHDKWSEEGAPVGGLSIGIGIETGPMMIGLVGAEEHLKPGAVGDAVNVAARVQQLDVACGYPLLVTRTTISHGFPEIGINDDHNNQIAVENNIVLHACGSQHLRGRDEPVDIYGIASRIR